MNVTNDRFKDRQLHIEAICKWYRWNGKSMQKCPLVRGLLNTTASSQIFRRTAGGDFTAG